MTEPIQKNTPYFIKPNIVHIDSSEAFIREEGEASAYHYRVKTNFYSRVVGLKLISWSIPNSIAPSFIDSTGLIKGNSFVDFRLEDTDGILGTENFFFQWPEQKFRYINVLQNQSSYIETLAALLNSAVNSRDTSDWNGNVLFTGITQADEKTIIQIESRGAVFSGDPARAILTFTFGTGTHREKSAATQMGFERGIDYESVLFQGVNIIESPYPVNLDPFQYIDVSIEEFPELKPHRIYIEDGFDAAQTVRNVTEAPFVPILSSGNNNDMQYFTVKLRLKNGVVPLALNRDHHLTFCVYTLQPESSVPLYLRNQVMFL